MSDFDTEAARRRALEIQGMPWWVVGGKAGVAAMESMDRAAPKVVIWIVTEVMLAGLGAESESSGTSHPVDKGSTTS